MANESYLSLEGGEAMVEFIILNSSITDAEIKAWQLAQKGNKNVCPHHHPLYAVGVTGMV